MDARAVRLIGWNQEEADKHAAVIRAWGYTVSAKVPESGTELLRELRPNPPYAILIDLDRLPSHGKELAAYLRASKPLRSTPLVMVGGAPEKVAKLRDAMPDVVYTCWERLRETLATVTPVANPVPVQFTIATNAPIASKLNIKPGMRVYAPNAPASFFHTVGDLPEEAEWVESPPCDLEICFVTTAAELDNRFTRPVRHPLWIAWPKGTAELKQQPIREWGASVGLVDYKICAIDKTWSAMLFTRRRAIARKG